MPDPVDLKAVFNMPPADAVSYFRAKGYQVTDRWQEMLHSAHARAFTVAKAMRMDLLEDIRGAVDDALSQGLTERDFIKYLKPKLQAKGWWGEQTWVNKHGEARQVKLGSERRLKTIYRTNTQTAYMAGRYRRQLAASETHPYWQYVAIDDVATRPAHRALNGKVFRWDDPIWQYLYPPNGWGCRCRVRALTESQLQRMGLTVNNGADWLSTERIEVGSDPATGEVWLEDQAVVSIPGGRTMRPDPGWSYNAGAAAYGADAAIAKKLATVPDVAVRSQLVQALNNSPLRQQQYADWAQSVLDERRPGHSIQTLAFMTEGVAAAVAQRLGKEPSRLLAINEKALVHADSEKHQSKGVALTRDEYVQLPAMLNNPQAVLWDRDNNNLLYVMPSEGEANIKVVVSAPYRVKGHKMPLDVVINTYRVKMQDLLAGRYDVLEGSIE